MKKTTLRIFLISATLIFFLIVYSCNLSIREKENKPNIIIILADDMGFSDPGCFGGEIQTPNLDYLSSNGLRFSQFYNASRSCPTRASLLTGLYSHVAGIGEMTTDRHTEGYRGYLTENTVTLAEVLKEAGYNTAMSGKWHVSNTPAIEDPLDQLNWLNHHEEHPLFSPIEQYPTSRGFNKFFGTVWGVVDYFDPFSLTDGTLPVKSVPQNYYQTDAINDTAVAYIKEFSKEDKPFFLYVAHNAPHWPLMALPEDIDKYKETYKVGWDVIRQGRYNKLVLEGIIDSAKYPLSPRLKNEIKWENNPDKEWDAMAMSVHAAMVDRMDQGIGRIISALQESGQIENTLILFLSDNGASPEDCARYGPGFDRPDETRKGEKIIYPTDKRTLPGPETTFSSIGPIWANVSNTPFRLAKAESYEGGIHTPMIAFWPKGIKVKKGSVSDHLGHVVDFMSTCVELAQTTYPVKYKGHSISPMQGLSLVPVFKNKKAPEHVNLFNEHFGARYIRTDNWKLVSTASDSTWHLYNLEVDRTELNDLSVQFPNKEKEMKRIWTKWALHNKVLPK